MKNARRPCATAALVIVGIGALMPWQWRHRNDDPSTADLLGPLLVHAGLWCGAGLAAGLAFGIGLGRRMKSARLLETALAGLTGAFLGTILFEFMGALMMPLAKTADPISETAGSRLLARLCVAISVALGAIYCVRRGQPPEPAREAHVAT